MTHFFNVTKPVFDTIGENDHQIIRFKVLPKEGDEIVWQRVHDKDLQQKKTVIKRVNTDTIGLMKNYYFVEHEEVGNEK